jgi:hypothetical protein
MPKAKTEAKPALNVRDIPADLMARLKADAASKGITLREHCIALLDGQRRSAIEQLAALPTVTVASQLPSLDGDHPGPKPGRCPRCNAALIPFGPGQTRCRTCAMNYPAG